MSRARIRRLYLLAPVQIAAGGKRYLNLNRAQVGRKLADLTVPKTDKGMGEAIAFFVLRVSNTDAVPQVESIVGAGGAPSTMPYEMAKQVLQTVTDEQLYERFADFADREEEEELRNDALRVADVKPAPGTDRDS